jgi:hypothetical protein
MGPCTTISGNPEIIKCSFQKCPRYVAYKSENIGHVTQVVIVGFLMVAYFRHFLLGLGSNPLLHSPKAEKKIVLNKVSITICV